MPLLAGLDAAFDILLARMIAHFPPPWLLLVVSASMQPAQSVAYSPALPLWSHTIRPFLPFLQHTRCRIHLSVTSPGLAAGSATLFGPYPPFASASLLVLAPLPILLPLLPLHFDLNSQTNQPDPSTVWLFETMAML